MLYSLVHINETSPYEVFAYEEEDVYKRQTVGMLYGGTQLETGNAEINELISTRGMAGMMNTIWSVSYTHLLIISSQTELSVFCQ